MVLIRVGFNDAREGKKANNLKTISKEKRQRVLCNTPRKFLLALKIRILLENLGSTSVCSSISSFLEKGLW